jgi:UDP-GlcNAc:undecaprenyl-phosphate/decaprenyl-phosphate GlcNAc-1-phosphate transferase
VNTSLVALLLSFIVAAILTPVIRSLSFRMGAVEKTGLSHRKVHAETVPRTGGIGIVLGFYAPLIGLLFYETGLGRELVTHPDTMLGLFIGPAIIAALGLYDDLRGASPLLKLLVQALVAVALVYSGFGITVVDLPFIQEFELGWLTWPITILWLLGITNAVNLIDGLDGLAAGVALLAIAPMAMVAAISGRPLLALVLASLAGSVMGFLVYNWHPAKIFMGDVGSMFLGFVLAVATVMTSFKSGAAAAFTAPVLALGLPVFDTILTIIRRAVRGQPIFQADKQHIHHRLLESGLSHRGTVLVLYGVGASFSGTALVMSLYRDFTAGLVMVVPVVVILSVLWRIGYLKAPAGLSGMVAIRAQNQAVRASLPIVQQEIASARSIEDVAMLGGELARLTGASSAQLSLWLPNQPKRQWEWDDVKEHTEEIAYPLFVGEDEVGRLVIRWAGPVEEMMYSSVESGLRGINEKLALLAGAES